MIIHFNPIAAEDAGFNWFKDKAVNQTEKVFGTTGLLEFLELYSGFRSLEIPRQLRLVKATELLKSHVNTNHTFYKSFSANEFAFADHLLKLLDELVMLEWNGVYEKNTPRLELLNILNINLQNYPGEAHRWVAIKKYILTNGFPSNLVSKILIYESVETIHPFFNDWFEKVFPGKIKYCQVEEKDEKEDNNLSKVRKAFITQNFNIGSLNTLEKDNSLILINSDSSRVISDLLCQLKPGLIRDSILINSKAGNTLDSAFSRVNKPNLSASNGSENNSLNLLHFHLLSLLYPVPDSYELIRFLSSKFCPIRKEVRYKLKKILIDSPGYDFEYYKELLVEEAAEIEDAQERKAQEKLVNSEMDLWFLKTGKAVFKNDKLYFNRLGVISIIQSAIDTFNNENKCSLKPLDADKALTFLNSIKESMEVISKNDISEAELMVLYAGFIQAYKSPWVIPEANSLAVINSPSALIDEMRFVLWWCPSSTDGLVSQLSLYKNEEKVLLNNSLWTEDFKLKVQKSWYNGSIKPLLNAQESLIIFTASKSEGESLSSHPFIDYLAASVKNLNEITIDLPGDLDLEISKLKNHPAFEFLTKPVEVVKLPANKTAWNLNIDEDLIEFPEKESFSSLEKLIYYPHEYFLEKIARINESSLPDSDSEFLNFGNLSHSIFEQFFGDLNKNISDQEIQKRILNITQQQIKKTFGLLDRPESRIRKEAFIKEMYTAAIVLMNFIQKSPFTIFETEKEIGYDEDVNLGSIVLRGSIDLVLSNEKGEKAIIDLKWAGKTKRMDMLKKGNDLQLPIYSHLLSNDSTVPTSFFIINKALLITYPNKYFPGAYTIDVPPVSSKEILEKIKQAYEIRQSEIKSGYIEVGSEESFTVLAENSEIWNPEELNFPEPYKANGKKPLNPYSSYTNISGLNNE